MVWYGMVLTQYHTIPYHTTWYWYGIGYQSREAAKLPRHRSPTPLLKPYNFTATAPNCDNLGLK